MSRKARVLIASYTGAALVALSIFSAVCYGHLRIYRRQTGYDAARAFEETVGGIDRLSRSLEKSLYAADGGMCGKVCAEICADARTAETAMSALPFSTVELEQIRGFLGLVGDYAYTLCREAAERGFTDEQRRDLAAMSDTASELAVAVRRMQTGVNEGRLTMDSREAQIANVGVDEELRWLSAELVDCEANFTPLEAPRYDGRYTAVEAREETPPDEQTARTLAASALSAAPEELETAADYADASRLCYRSGTRTVCVSAAGLETLTDSRLVSEARLSEDEGRAAAEAFLAQQGCEGLHLEDSRQSGALLSLRYASAAGEVANLDKTVTVTVALDDGSIYAYDACALSTEAAAEGWDGKATPEEWVPAGLTLEGVRKVTLQSAGGRSLPCWELSCRGAEEREVTLYINALTGKQQEIVVE
ncbi:MAG: germination protein YpeB [Oscillospiraceae bacterium]|nr:germination protein YpeB [Oscillospiraceae bacterium]